MKNTTKVDDERTTHLKFHNCTAKEFRIDGTYTIEEEGVENHYDFTIIYNGYANANEVPHEPHKGREIRWTEDAPDNTDVGAIEDFILDSFAQERQQLLKQSELTLTEHEEPYAHFVTNLLNELREEMGEYNGGEFIVNEATDTFIAEFAERKMKQEPPTFTAEQYETIRAAWNNAYGEDITKEYSGFWEAIQGKGQLKLPTTPALSFEDDWMSTHTPIKNHLVGEDAPYDGCMFETYGEELEYLQTQNARNIWTIVDGDDGVYLIAGAHVVNRIGYLLTKEEWTDDEEKNCEWLIALNEPEETETK